MLNKFPEFVLIEFLYFYFLGFLFYFYEQLVQAIRTVGAQSPWDPLLNILLYVQSEWPLPCSNRQNSSSWSFKFCSSMIQTPVQNEWSLLSPVLETGSRFFADSSWQLPSKQSRKRLFSMASTLSEFRLLEEVNTLKDSVHWNSKKKLTS